jgi:6-phospho-3-hexuloisomerase
VTNVATFAAKALEELGEVFARLDPAPVADALDAMAGAGRLALYGVGREGLAMRGFAMRLFHMGLDAAVVGDMTTPPVGPCDLLLVSAGPGGFSTVLGLMGVARDAGARTLVFTAQPGGAAAAVADLVVPVPAQTMANDLGADDLGADDVGGNHVGPDDRTGRPAAAPSVLPMGSLYEGALFVLFEAMVVALRDRLGVAPEAMRARHTNLE